MEVTADTLRENGLDPNMTAVFDKSFKLYRCYKHTRQEMVAMIKNSSELVETNAKRFYWMLAPNTYLMNTMCWSVAKKEPENIFKEPTFTMRRDELVGFHAFSEELLNHMLSPSCDVSPQEIYSLYGDNKEFCKFSQSFAYMKTDTLLPGNKALLKHLKFLFEAVSTKNEDYQLIRKILR